MSDPRQTGRAGFSETAAAFASEARLGERLAARGLLPRASIANISRLQRHWGCRFDEVLVATGWVTPVELAEVLAEDLGLEFADLIAAPPEAGLGEKGHVDLYLRHLFVPWRRHANTITANLNRRGRDRRHGRWASGRVRKAHNDAPRSRQPRLSRKAKEGR